MTAPDVPTGAMIALVPTAADAQRLAVQGGEAVNDLHLTLCYLGDAAQIEDIVWSQLTDAMRGLADTWDYVEADAFAPALFNPAGEEPCVTLICSGADLAEFYETVLADVTEIMTLPADLHAPWIPHVTLVYPDDPRDMSWVLSAIDRTGPLVFDRIRLARAGEIIDIPIDGYGQVVSEEPTAEVPPADVGAEEAPAAAPAEPAADLPALTAAGAPLVEAYVREVWDGPLTDHWR